MLPVATPLIKAETQRATAQLPPEPGILSKDEVAAQAATSTLASMIAMASQSKKSSWRIQYANSRLRAPLRVHNTARGTNSIWFARW